MNLGGLSAVQVSGTNALDFSVISGPPTTLGAGQSGTFTMSFVPQGSGSRTATVKIAPSDGSSGYSFTITGTGNGSGTASVSWSISGTVTGGAINSGDTINMGDINHTPGGVGVNIYIGNAQPSPSILYLTETPNIQMTGGGTAFYGLVQPVSNQVKQSSGQVNGGVTVADSASGLTLGNSYSASFSIPMSDAANPVFTFTLTYTYH